MTICSNVSLKRERVDSNGVIFYSPFFFMLSKRKFAHRLTIAGCFHIFRLFIINLSYGCTFIVHLVHLALCLKLYNWDFVYSFFFMMLLATVGFLLLLVTTRGQDILFPNSSSEDVINENIESVWPVSFFFFRNFWPVWSKKYILRTRVNKKYFLN